MTTATARPLDGVRILDFSRVLSGPLSTALLADLGAEVIKVEPPGGDDYRWIGPIQNGASALFTALNRNKRSITLDLKHPEAARTVRELALYADVVVENFRPGVAERLGLGHAELLQANPKLVYVSVSGFGQSGPLSHLPAYDVIVQAMSGLMEATGAPDGPPMMVGEAVSDVVAGLFASWATLAALLQCQRTGQGQHVDVAMFDTTLSFLVTAVGRYLFTGQPPRRRGNRHAFSAPFGVFRAADGHFALAVLNNKLFATTAALIGRPEFAHDPRFATDELRSANEAPLSEAIEHWAGALSVAEVVRQLAAAGVPGGPLWTVSQALESEQAVHRGLLQPVDDPALPGLRVPTQPVKFGGAAPNRADPAPLLGQHTDEVMAGLLQCGAARLAELRAAGLFGLAGGSAAAH